MATYGPYCANARGAEIFAERWTPLLIRNLDLGCGSPKCPSASQTLHFVAHARGSFFEAILLLLRERILFLESPVQRVDTGDERTAEGLAVLLVCGIGADPSLTVVTI